MKLREHLNLFSSLNSPKEWTELTHHKQFSFNRISNQNKQQRSYKLHLLPMPFHSFNILFYLLHWTYSSLWSNQCQFFSKDGVFIPNMKDTPSCTSNTFWIYCRVSPLCSLFHKDFTEEVDYQTILPFDVFSWWVK